MPFHNESKISQADKQEWMLGLFALILTCLALFPLKNQYCSGTTKSKEPRAIIVIDPGHGGKDPGKIAADGTLEKDLNLQVANCLCEKLSKVGYRVIMTRTEDVTATGSEEGKKLEDMHKRIAIIKEEKADICVSIHMNSYATTSANGPQVFYYEGSEESQRLAAGIQQSLCEKVSPDCTRKETGNRSYFMLKKSLCPTVIVECGFLSNPTETAKLREKGYQERLAAAICDGILNYFT